MDLLLMKLQQEAMSETTSPSRLWELAEIHNDLAGLVAKNPNTPADLLQHLSVQYPELGSSIAGNPNTPIEVLKKLSRSFTKEVFNNPVLSLLLLEDPNVITKNFPSSVLLKLILQNKIPKSQLIQLKTLDLSGNQLIKIPSEIFQLKNLTSLNLSWNQLTELSPDICQLQNLTSLDISCNQLTKFPPEIYQLKKLTYLHLTANQIVEPPLEIGQLTNLEYFNLRGNPLRKPLSEVELENYIIQLKQLKNLTYFHGCVFW